MNNCRAMPCGLARQPVSRIGKGQNTHTMSNITEKIKDECVQILNLWKLNYRTRFTGTQIGKIWIGLSPLLQIGVYVFAFGFVFAGDGGNPLQHVIWLICGYGPWQAISEGIMSAANSLVANRAILKNFDMRPYYFPIAASLMGIPSICVVLIFASILVLASGIGLSLYALWLIVAIPLLFLIIMGIGLIVSSLVVFVRDLVQVLSVVLMMTMFFTPILYYPERLPPFLQGFVVLNPFYQIVEMYRSALYYQKNISLVGFLVVAAWIAVIWAAGWKLFKRLSGSFESAL